MKQWFQDVNLLCQGFFDAVALVACHAFFHSFQAVDTTVCTTLETVCLPSSTGIVFANKLIVICKIGLYGFQVVWPSQLVDPYEKVTINRSLFFFASHFHVSHIALTTSELLPQNLRRAAFLIIRVAEQQKHWARFLRIGGFRLVKADSEVAPRITKGNFEH